MLEYQLTIPVSDSSNDDMIKYLVKSLSVMIDRPNTVEVQQEIAALILSVLASRDNIMNIQCDIS